MKLSGLVLVLVMLFSLASIAQESSKKESKNIVYINLGASYIPNGSQIGSTGSKGFFIPIVGLYYYRVLSSKWKVGLMSDYQLGDYLFLDGDLERSKALAVAAVGSYSITPEFHVFGGGGIEFEKNNNLWLYRAGLEYNFNLGNGWVFAPVFTYDFKEYIDTWSLSVAFGKEF